MQRRRYSICLATAEDNPQKKTARYREQDREKVAAYQEQIKDIPPEKIAYVDECGIDTYLYREYGYAPRGQKVFDQISGRKYKRCGIVAANGDNYPTIFRHIQLYTAFIGESQSIFLIMLRNF